MKLSIYRTFRADDCGWASAGWKKNFAPWESIQSGARRLPMRRPVLESSLRLREIHYESRFQSFTRLANNHERATEKLAGLLNVK